MLTSSITSSVHWYSEHYKNQRLSISGFRWPFFLCYSCKLCVLTCMLRIITRFQNSGRQSYSRCARTQGKRNYYTTTTWLWLGTSFSSQLSTFGELVPVKTTKAFVESTTISSYLQRDQLCSVYWYAFAERGCSSLANSSRHSYYLSYCSVPKTLMLFPTFF